MKRHMKVGDWLVIIGIISLVIALFGVVVLEKKQRAKIANHVGIIDSYDGNRVEVLRDEQHFVTCYVYRGYGISCVRDHGR